MTLTNEIFAALEKAGTPLSIGAIMEALVTETDRNTVSAMLGQRRRAGELVTTLEDGKVHYALAPDYDGRKRRGARPPAAKADSSQEPLAPTANASQPKSPRSPRRNKENAANEADRVAGNPPCQALSSLHAELVACRDQLSHLLATAVQESLPPLQARALARAYLALSEACVVAS